MRERSERVERQLKAFLPCQVEHGRLAVVHGPPPAPGDRGASADVDRRTIPLLRDQDACFLEQLAQRGDAGGEREVGETLGTDRERAKARIAVRRVDLAAGEHQRPAREGKARMAERHEDLDTRRAVAQQQHARGRQRRRRSRHRSPMSNSSQERPYAPSPSSSNSPRSGVPMR